MRVSRFPSSVSSLPGSRDDALESPSTQARYDQRHRQALHDFSLERYKYILQQIQHRQRERLQIPGDLPGAGDHGGRCGDRLVHGIPTTGSRSEPGPRRSRRSASPVSSAASTTCCPPSGSTGSRRLIWHATPVAPRDPRTVEVQRHRMVRYGMPSGALVGEHTRQRGNVPETSAAAAGLNSAGGHGRPVRAAVLCHSPSCPRPAPSTLRLHRRPPTRMRTDLGGSTLSASSRRRPRRRLRRR